MTRMERWHWFLGSGLGVLLVGCPANKLPATPKAAAPYSTPPAAGYTGGPVTSGGSLKGHVTFVGTPPKLPPTKCARDSDVCGKPRPNRTVTVGTGGGLANVIVSLQDVHAGKAMPKGTAKLEIKACDYTPRVQAVPLGTSLLVTNRDPIPHDLNGARGDRVLFNRSVLSSQERLDMSVAGMVNIDCDDHDKGGGCESGVVGVMPNPYFALTGDDGSFTIADIPPGSYTLQAWHETLGEQSQKITITPGGSAPVDFKFAVKGK
jgi:hypothetical protein